jgi:hypothetical protein
VAAIDMGELQMLDSIQRVIRTSLIHSNNGIALRSDITALRLGVIRTFEQAVPRLSLHMRERLDRTRVELAAMGRVFGDSEGSGTIVLDGNAQVVYRLIPARDLFVGDQADMFNGPTEVVLDFDNEPFFAVDPHALRALETCASVQVPPFPMGANVAVEAPHMESNPAGVRPSRRRAVVIEEGTSEIPVPADPDDAQDIDEMPARQHTNAREVYGLTLRVRRNDSLLNAADRAIREAEEKLNRFDSLMRTMQKQGRKKDGKDHSGDPNSKDSGSGSGAVGAGGN